MDCSDLNDLIQAKSAGLAGLIRAFLPELIVSRWMQDKMPIPRLNVDEALERTKMIEEAEASFLLVGIIMQDITTIQEQAAKAIEKAEDASYFRGN